MKKNIIIAAVIIAALAFGVTSCKKDEAKCWKVAASANFEGEIESITFYIWCTESECDSRIADAKKAAEDEGRTDFEAEKEEASKFTTEADCDAQNDYENTKFLWP